MALDLAASRAERPALPLGVARLAAIPAGLVLAGIVAISFVLRAVTAFAHAAPLYFPDEYIYSSLARAIAASGRPLIRGGSAHFPALLEPLLAAPTWLFGSTETAYRLTQCEHALAMSLAALPVYALARRLDLGAGFALGAAAIAVASPDLVFASSILADPIAYPLVLSAVYFGVCALDGGTARAHLAFVASSGLATFARVQYVLLPLVFVGAAFVVERGRILETMRRLRVSLLLLGLPAIAVGVAGPSRVLGYYSHATHLSVRPGAVLHWASTDALLLCYSAGWLLVPGALVGLTLALLRPRARVERAFAAVTVLLAGGMLAEAALYAANGAGRFQERYLFAMLPLLAPAFGLYVRRGCPGRLAVALLALGGLAVSVRIPLTGYSALTGKQDSPYLFAVYRLQELLGSPGDAGLVVALAAAVCLLAGAGLAWRPRLAAPIGLVLTLAVTGAASAGAISYDARQAARARASYLPGDRQWIDHAGLRRVALLQTPGSSREGALEQLFWNRSVTDVLLLAGAVSPDTFRATRVRVARDGRLLVGGTPLRRPILVDGEAVTAELAGAKRVASHPAFDLWQPEGTARLSLLTGGRYLDGWLARSGWIRVWPDESGRVRGVLHLRLSLPAGTPHVPLRLRGPGLDRTVEIAPGTPSEVAIPVAAGGPWTLRFETSRSVTLTDGRPVSVRGERPRFTRD